MTPTSRPNLQQTGSRETDTFSLLEGEGLLPGSPTAREKGMAVWGRGSPHPGPPGSRGQAVLKPTSNTLLGGRQRPPSPQGPPPSLPAGALCPHPSALSTPRRESWGLGPAPHLHMAAHTSAPLLPTAPRDPSLHPWLPGPSVHPEKPRICPSTPSVSWRSAGQPTARQLEREGARLARPPSRPFGGDEPSRLPPREEPRAWAPGDLQPGCGLRDCWAAKGPQGLPHWMLRQVEAVNPSPAAQTGRAVFKEQILFHVISVSFWGHFFPISHPVPAYMASPLQRAQN